MPTRVKLACSWRAWKASARREGRRLRAPRWTPLMSPAARLPAWADYILVPVLNVTAAFLVSGLVVLMIGENPLKAVQFLVYGALGYGEGIGFTLFYAT